MSEYQTNHCTLSIIQSGVFIENCTYFKEIVRTKKSAKMKKNPCTILKIKVKSSLFLISKNRGVMELGTPGIRKKCLILIRDAFHRPTYFAATSHSFWAMAMS